MDPGGEDDCAVGVGNGSDREDDSREGCLGYEPRRGTFRSRSPERKEFSVWRRDDDNDKKDLCELPPVNAPPLAAIAPTDVFMAAEEPQFQVGVGLTNLGNTCFLNSVLQCLVRTSPFRQGLCMIDHYSPCYGEEFCLICCLRELVHRSFTSSDEIAPYPIASNLKYFSPDFMRYQQEDAHEFLQCLLDKLEKYSMVPSNMFSPPPIRNLVKQVFGGSLVSRLRCSECNHISCTPEDLIDFSLEIDDVTTLEGALDSFTKSEKIEDIKMTCDGCNEKVSMEKQFIVDQTPLVASFHLKRFKNDGIMVEKIGKHIEFPLTLNLHPYAVGHPEHTDELVYDLYAVIVHDGLSSDSGHYYCFVRSSPSTWHEFDDSTVTRVSESYVLSRDAYILFYAKRGSSWFYNFNDVPSLCYPVTQKYSPNSVLEKANQSSESDSSTENLTMRVKEFSEDSYRPAPMASQLLNVEAKITNDLLGEHSNLLDSKEDYDKNEVDMLLNDKDGENKNKTDAAISLPQKLDLIKDKANNAGKVMTDINGISIGFQEEREATRDQIRPISSHAIDNIIVPSHINEAGNFRNKYTTSVGEEPSKSPNCTAASTCSPGVTAKNTINKSRNMTEPTSCQIGLNDSREATNLSNLPVQRKRSAEKPVDDARKRQVLKTLKKANMPMTRAKQLLAAMNGSPIKKDKKSPISLGKKLSPRTACRKNQNRLVSPSVRSAIFR